MGLQDRLIMCGTKLAIFGMVLRFLTGPAVFAAASYLVGMRGVSLRVAIVQVDFLEMRIGDLKFSSTAARNG